MKTTERSIPLYVRLSHIAVLLIAIFYVLYIGQTILIPIVLAGLFAILLNPLVNQLNAKGVNRTVAILLSLLAAVVVVTGFLFFISTQFSKFTSTLPLLQEKFSMLFEKALDWGSHAVNADKEGIRNWMDDLKNQGLSNSPSMLGRTIGTIGGMLAVIFLIPIYIFFILFYKNLLVNFFFKLFLKENHGMVVEVLSETKKLIQSYLFGLLMEIGIVAAMSITALLIIGVPNAILLGLIGAVLNLIPYIGVLITNILSALLALATGSPLSALLVIGAYSVIQFIDNNYIVPRIVASKVKLNALVSIIAVLVGGALWGIPGMFLSIPLTAIAKVIFDRIEQMEAFGYVLGDDHLPTGKSVFPKSEKERALPEKEAS